MKLFIDTSILLEIYQSAGPSLDEFRKLAELVETGKIELLLSQQVVDEFWRCREDVIADALRRFRESGAQATIPDFIRSYVVESADLSKAIAKVNAAVSDLDTKIQRDAAATALEADGIILGLFAAVPAEPTEAFVSAARRRTDMGNPPGDEGNLGGAINWEWLLNRGVSIDTTEIVILSGHGNFESQLVKGKLREFLRLDWSRRYPYCELRLEQSLAELLVRDFPATTPDG